MSTKKLLCVYSYGNKRDLQSHPDEQQHELSIELAGVAHPVSFAAIPLEITSSLDDGPEVTLNESETLAITDEIAHRANCYDELLAALIEAKENLEYLGLKDNGLPGMMQRINLAIAKAEGTK